jgi:hypothetical protein
MPPLMTLPDGRTGYYDTNTGEFIEATLAQYNALTGASSNPFAVPQPNIQQQQAVPFGTMPQTNEQKVSQQSGQVFMDYRGPNLPYGQYDQGLGFKDARGNFVPSTASTKTGAALIGKPQMGLSMPVWNFNADSNQGNIMSNMFAPQQAVQQPTQQPVTTAPNIGGELSAQAQQFLLGQKTTDNTGTENAGGGGASGSWDEADPKKIGLSKDMKYNLASMGVGIGTNLIKTAAPGNYDERVGMTKPNAVGSIFGDGTFTQIGLNPALMGATGGMSAVAGVGVDLIKNTIGYKMQLDKYNNKKIGVGAQEGMQNQRSQMGYDYTGYARYGTEVKNPFLKFSSGGEVTEPTVPTQQHVAKGKEMYRKIVESEGYKKKLQNELIQSSGMAFPGKLPMTGDYIGDTNLEYATRNFYDFDFERLYKDRLDAVNAPIRIAENENHNKRILGIHTVNKVKNEPLNEMGIYENKSDITIFNTPHTNPEYSVLEETEHKGNTIPFIKEGESKLNVTPYARSIFDENVPQKKIENYAFHDDRYLNNYTEMMAKKRAMEAYLVEKGKLQPGAEVDDSHFDFLQQQSDLPANVSQGLEMLMGEEDDLETRVKNARERFKPIMNKIAYNQSAGNNPYLV